MAIQGDESTNSIHLPPRQVDPKTKAGELQLPEEVAGAGGKAKLTAKVENDMHCEQQPACARTVGRSQ